MACYDGVIRSHAAVRAGSGIVSYPRAQARGLHLRGITVAPSGVLLPAHPYPVRIGWPADNQRGAVRPVYVQVTPTLSLVSGCWPMPLDVTLLSTLLAVSRVIAARSHKRGDGASSPGRKSGVSAPEI